MTTEIFNLIKEEEKRQQDTIELIASENITSKNIREACGSVLTNKYAEGYPYKRYYSGCINVDKIEEIAIESCKKLFSCKFANVQPHSGSNANEIAYFSLLEAGDKILGMSLDAGGHLTHGYKINFSGKNYQSFSYGVNKEGFLDYNEIEKLAKEIKPKLIIAGASAYPRKIDFKKFSEIANSVGAYLMVDMAHIAGLIASNLHQSPVDYADIITSTTHKTLRGPRGGFIITNNEEISKKINKACFPGFQGGPLEHIIAGKAICFQEALLSSFKEYQEQVLKNSKALSSKLFEYGFNLVTNGTDNHLILVDLRSKKITGKKAEELLEKCNISVNKNAIPNDPEKPFIASGIRIGTPAITTRGVKEDGIEIIAKFINDILSNPEDFEKHEKIKKDVISFLEKYPINKI
jgi:glycine hydroxymethyltransferase